MTGSLLGSLVPILSGTHWRGRDGETWMVNFAPSLQRHLHTHVFLHFYPPLLAQVLRLVLQWCLTLCDPMKCSPPGFLCPWDSPGKNPGVGSSSLLQGIFPTRGSNPGLPHRRWILYQLSHQGSPRILEWVAYPFCRGSSQLRNPTRVSCIAGEFLTS